MQERKNPFRLDGKVALVTGAGRGIGARAAEVLAEAGAKVILTDVVDEWGLATAAGIRKGGMEAAFRHLDVTCEEEWIAVLQETVQTYGGLDILVNNAGVTGVGMIENVSVEQWRKVMAVNADGVFLGVKQGMLAMKPGGVAGKGGSIINISSICGIVAIAGSAAYSAAKAAVRLLTKVAAVECGQLKYGIRVNSVHPGVTRTDLVEHGFVELANDGLFATPADAEAAQIAMHPIGRLGRPDDIANAILYLASDASAFMTGAELVVDGGLTAQ